MKSPKAKALDLRISRSAQKKRQDQGHFIRYTKQKARRYRAFCNCGNSRPAHAAAPEQVDDRQQDDRTDQRGDQVARSEEHTSEIKSLMRISYVVFCSTKQTLPL